MDAETQQVAEKLARFVAEGGPEVEAIAAERNRDNPAFRSVTVYVTVFLIMTSCVFFVLSLVLLWLFLTSHKMYTVLPTVFYMITKVQLTTSTKTKFRSIVLPSPRAPHLLQQSSGQMFSDQLFHHFQESLQH